MVDKQGTNEALRELALFAGAGGGILAGQRLGWKTVCAVELNGYAASILAQRQNDGFLEPFPIWSDICTFDGKPWNGIIDVISGGFPCQDISAAGKGAGIDGNKSGLWQQMARIIDEVRPGFVFVENSPLLISRGLDRVISDLAAMGYDAKWGIVGAHHVGAPHRRDRIWIVAYTDIDRLQRINTKPSTEKNQKKEWNDIKRVAYEVQRGKRNRIPSSWFLRKNAGMAYRMDRAKAIGNGQVPLAASTAWRILQSL